MKIVFFGTPQFSADFLQALIAAPNIEVAAVVTQPDEPQGRKRILTPPPTKVLAEANGIPVHQPAKVKNNTELFDALRAHQADAFVVIAYGRILPQELLDIPPKGVINVHPSLLPKFRGPSPMQAAIAAGETETGISIMLLDAGMDHGPILAVETLPLDPQETTETLMRKVVTLGAPLLIATLTKWVDGAITPAEQNHDTATFCKILSREDGRVIWADPAEVTERKLRAFTPWPGISTTWNRNGEPITLKIIRALVSDRALDAGQVQIDGDRLFIGTGSTALEVLDLQPSGGKPMPATAFIRGYSDIANALLS